MNKDYSELIQHLDRKFSNIDGEFSIVKESLMNLRERLVNLEENKADKSDINDLMTAIDSYAKRADTYFQEMVMLSHKVDRHEKWFQLIAKKLDLKLEY
ncbi:hypothetical protein KJ562_01310 [Patescibacteria group bacterium]|nr:hypothetical protein [Patescibacteria group bacterium]MBU4162386.1 hypothetical protein [Patescibacteria group bacterium]